MLSSPTCSAMQVLSFRARSLAGMPSPTAARGGLVLAGRARAATGAAGAGLDKGEHAGTIRPAPRERTYGVIVIVIRPSAGVIVIVIVDRDRDRDREG